MGSFSDLYGCLVEDIQTIVEAARVYGSPSHVVDDRVFDVTSNLGYVID